jgi:hypothetical protein
MTLRAIFFQNTIPKAGQVLKIKVLAASTEIEQGYAIPDRVCQQLI